MRYYLAKMGLLAWLVLFGTQYAALAADGGLYEEGLAVPSLAGVVANASKWQQPQASPLFDTPTAQFVETNHPFHFLFESQESKETEQEEENDEEPLASAAIWTGWLPATGSPIVCALAQVPVVVNRRYILYHALKIPCI